MQTKGSDHSTGDSDREKSSSGSCVKRRELESIPTNP